MINKDLIKRIITALILLPIVVFILLSSKKLFILLLIAVLILSTYEWFRLNKNRVSIISLAGFLIILTSIFFSYFLRGNDYESIIVFKFKNRTSTLKKWKIKIGKIEKTNDPYMPA